MADPSESARAWLRRFLEEPTFLAKYPYYAAVLARMHPVVDPSVKQMAVSLEDGRFYLHVNAAYFAEHPQFLTGILLHEVHHVVLGHLSDEKFRNLEEADLLELAVEMSANEHIEEPLPDPIVWKSFERYGVRAGQSTLTRYDKLTKNRPHVGDRSKPVDDHGPWKASEPRPGAREQTRLLVASAVAEVQAKAGHGDDALPWAKPKLAGRDPGRLLEDLTYPAREPLVHVDWRKAIEPFVAETRVRVHTYSRPSRRFPTRIGEVPGRLFGSRRGLRPHVLVVIDTSLSMTTEELREVGFHLVRLSDLARLTVAECDTELTRVYPFAGVLDRVKGRGGTDLRPPFVPAFLAELGVDGVIYFTDGQGPFLEDPPAVPTLWILTKPDEFLCSWGRRVALNRSSARR
jgi:predicted metal-dependent peptidase